MTDIESYVLTLNKDVGELRQNMHNLEHILQGRNGKEGMLLELHELKGRTETLINKQDALFSSLQDLRELVKGALYLMGGGVLVSLVLSVSAIVIAVSAYLR